VLRITTTTEKGAPVLKLEGKIGGPWVDELAQSWSVVVGHGGAKAVKVDMRGVSYVDRRGADLLLEMESKGASIVNCSHFLRQLVDSGVVDKQKAPTKTTQTKKES
jgi:anti-anti-sigma regulatory factor